MTDVVNPHDKFFKQLLTQPDAAETFLRTYLPRDVAVQLDLGALQLAKDSFVDASLQEHFSDLVFETQLHDHSGAYVCILFEHKSYVDPLTALQVLRYMVMGWEIYRPDLRVRLPEVMALWCTIRQKAHALDYLDAVIRYVTAASPNISVEDVRTAIEGMAPRLYGRYAARHPLGNTSHHRCTSIVNGSVYAPSCARG